MDFITEKLSTELLIILAIISFGTNNIYAQVTLSQNGSFEHANEQPGVQLTSGKIPFWEYYVLGEAEADFQIIIDGQIQDGTNALQIDITSVSDNPSDILLTNENFPIQQNQTYTYSVWAKADQPGAKATFSVGSPDFQLWQAEEEIQLSDEWQQFTFDFEINEDSTVWNTGIAQMFFSYEENEGNTIYIDHFKITGEQIEFEPVNFNSTFSQSILGNTVQTNISYWEASLHDSADARFEVVDDPLDSENKLLEVNIYETTPTRWHIQLINEPLTLTDGITYTLSTKIRTDSANARIDLWSDGGPENSYMLWSGLDWEEMEITIEDDGWQEISVDFTVNGTDLGFDEGHQFEMSRATINFSFEENTGRTIYVDNLQITESESDKSVNQNAGFEDANIGDAPLAGALGWEFHTPENSDSNFEIITSNANNDERAIKANIRDAFSDPMEKHVTGTPFIVRSGMTYQVSVIARSEIPNGILGVNLQLIAPVTTKNNSYSEFANTKNLQDENYEELTLSTEWEEYTFNVDIPVYLEEAAVFLMLGYEENDGNEIHISEVAVKPFGLFYENNLSVFDPEKDENENILLKWNRAHLDHNFYTLEVSHTQDFSEPVFRKVSITPSLFYDIELDMTVLGYRVPGLQPDQEYNWRLRGVNSRGIRSWTYGETFTPSELVVDIKNDPEIPNQISLEQNYPNPFNPTTVISYQLNSHQGVRLEVFDVTGRKVAVLVDGKQKPEGTYRVQFDGSGLSSGVYFYRLQTGGQTLTKKMLLLK